MGSYYIPRKDSLLLTWAEQFLNYLLPSLERFHFPAEEYAKLKERYRRFARALATADDPLTRTSLAIQEKCDTRRAFEKVLQQDVKEFLRFNRALRTSDREALGLPVYRSSRRPAPVAVDAPIAQIDSSVMAQITFRFFESVKRRKSAKPAGQHGVRLVWAMRDTPTVMIGDLLHSCISTGLSFTLTFENSQRGKTVYYALCWENMRGKKGPWGAIGRAIVP